MDDLEKRLTIQGREIVLSKRTPKGGWTREQLAQWGVSWPPPKGWMDKLISDSVEAHLRKIEKAQR